MMDIRAVNQSTTPKTRNAIVLENLQEAALQILGGWNHNNSTNQTGFVCQTVLYFNGQPISAWFVNLCCHFFIDCFV
jgi:hypothetical protein